MPNMHVNPENLGMLAFAVCLAIVFGDCSMVDTPEFLAVSTRVAICNMQS